MYMYIHSGSKNLKIHKIFQTLKYIFIYLYGGIFVKIVILIYLKWFYNFVSHMGGNG
jgi:hypothetical protein